MSPELWAKVPRWVSAGKSLAVRVLSWGLMSVMLLAVAGCGHGSRLYSSQDAKRAFAREGFVLVSMTAQPLDRSRILVPKSREPFTVVIARSEADAKYAYGKLRRETTRFTFDRRARNVITTSDTGLARSDKMRLRRAMAHLGEARLAHSMTTATPPRPPAARPPAPLSSAWR